MPFSMSENDLRQLFEEYGEVSSVNIITDRDTGRPRGFGFVDIEDEAAGREAIEKADGREIEGRRLKVNEARPKRERGGGGGGRGGGGGGGGRW
jgi:RNA recognition motif-containing protein